MTWQEPSERQYGPQEGDSAVYKSQLVKNKSKAAISASWHQLPITLQYSERKPVKVLSIVKPLGSTFKDRAFY